MSFAYLTLYTGDYLRDTRHLTPQKHGVYLLLLMYCWDSRGPAPLDEQECAGIANCRSADEIEALRYILSKYFVRMDDGHYNSRMQREIEKAENISGRRSNAGKLGYEARLKTLKNKRNLANAKQVLSNCSALASTPTTTTNTTTSTKKNHVAEKPADVCIDTWTDFLKTRRAKRAPLTPTALAGIVRESQKAGITLENALRTCCERGWQSFKAEWVGGKSGKTLLEKNQLAANEWLNSQRVEHEIN